MARGRRAGNADTKGLIVDSARRLFARDGYAAVSQRAIAREAGVDPALLHHYFGDKPQLFIASVLGEGFSLDPQQVLERVWTSQEGTLGEALVREVVTMWDAPGVGERIRAVYLSLQDHPEVVEQVHAVVGEVLMKGILERLGADRPHLRVSLMLSQMMGLMMMRYVVQPSIPPQEGNTAEGGGEGARASARELAAWVGPAVDRYLTGALPGDEGR